MTTFKLYSWNVNGLRSILKKGAFQTFLSQADPDFLCLQETKAKPHQVELDLPEYQAFWASADRPGYSGTVIFTKTSPIEYFANFPDDLQIQYPWHDDRYGNPLAEGRIQTAEFSHFYLVNVYTPNSKPDLSRLGLRGELWTPAFITFLKQLEQHKPVVVCGDFNAAHTAIDLARPKSNAKSAGFTPTERQGITDLIAAGFVDAFRTLHPDAQRYTWWSHYANARARNVGWRIDYFFISQSLLPQLQSAEIHETFIGSDHCPISITLEFD